MAAAAACKKTTLLHHEFRQARDAVCQPPRFLGG
jgi:hypothetical protein